MEFQEIPREEDLDKRASLRCTQTEQSVNSERATRQRTLKEKEGGKKSTRKERGQNSRISTLVTGISQIAGF
jgi:hypothetical protein